VCCSVLQHTHLNQLENHFVDFVPLFRCVAVSCSVLRCGAEWCSVLQSVAVCCSVLQCVATHTPDSTREPLCRFRPSISLCCSELQCAEVWCSVVQSGAVCCSVLQCVAVCCNTHTSINSRTKCTSTGKSRGRSSSR